MTEHIVAVFQSDQSATAAVQDLVKAGIPSSAIRKYAATGSGSTTQTGTTSGTGSSTASSGQSSSGSGFWAWVLGEESSGSGSGSTRDAYPDDTTYSRYYEAGNTVVSINLEDDSKIHQAIDILDTHHPLDIDESTEDSSYTSGSDVVPGLESGARTGVASSGTDYSSATSVTPANTMGTGPVGLTSGATAGGMTTASGTATGTTATGTPATSRTSTTGTGTTGTGTTATGTAANPGEQVIQLAEEQLNVGTRTVERGTTRVRRYVVSRPVEKEVTLHGERVTIERRRPVTSTGAGVGAFEERVVEVRETEEVPVVEKTARVVEEVAIRREATERKETVRDTVRREELEVAPDKDKPGTESHSGD